MADDICRRCGGYDWEAEGLKPCERCNGTGYDDGQSRLTCDECRCLTLVTDLRISDDNHSVCEACA